MMDKLFLPQGLCPSCFASSDGALPCRSCGYEGMAPENLTALPLGFVLENRYVVGRILGQGGFGITYQAYDTRLLQTVAIKEYFPLGLSNRHSGNFTVTYQMQDMKEGFETGKKKFLEEARSLARFDQHPHIVSVRDFFAGNGTVYMVMPCYKGQDFQRYLDQSEGRVSFQEALGILLPVMKALGDVHACGFIHRDVKPANIFITHSGEIRLLDFGAAKSVLSMLAPRTLSAGVGTEGYCPPEQSANRNMGPWTDVYGVAATFYRALTGELPPGARTGFRGDACASEREGSGGVGVN